MLNRRERYDRLTAEVKREGGMTPRMLRKVWEWQRLRLELADELGLTEQERAAARHWLERVPEPHP